MSPLEFALSPIKVEDFFEIYWEKLPCFIQREDPLYFNTLITLEDLDNVLAFSGLRYPSYRIISDQKSKPPYVDLDLGVTSNRQTTSFRLSEIYNEYQDGATLLFQLIDRKILNLKVFCEDLSHLFQFPIHSNAYLTPPNAQGFSCHYDTHDVLLLQSHGDKRWRVWSSVISNPMKTQKYAVTSDFINNVKSTTEPLIDCILRAGDTLYIPRGFPHEGYSLDHDSLHLTIGFFPHRALEISKMKVIEAIKELSEMDNYKGSVTKFMRGLEDIDQYIEILSQKIKKTDKK